MSRRVFALVVTVGLAAGVSAQSLDRMRVTSATNVRVRVSPSVEVTIVATLPLGADLVELGLNADGQWVRVRTAKGIEGWVLASLTRPVPTGGRDQVLQEVAARRSQGRYGFDAAVELVGVITELETRVTDPSARARLALYRLRALTNAASYTFPPAYSKPSSAWFKERSELFVYNAPGGSWMLKTEVILAEHDQHRGTPAAEQIAWLAVENGLPGECEGEVPCYVQRWNTIDGWYLAEYPSGSMVGSILQRLMVISSHWRAYQKDSRVFQAAAHCAPLANPLAQMRSIVAAARPIASERELHADVLRSLDLVAAACKTASAG